MTDAFDEPGSYQIEPGALDSQIGKTVPLSIGGIGGPVIGTATLRPDGHVEMALTELADLLAESSISIGRSFSFHWNSGS